MALGGNLKKKTLISNESEKTKSKKSKKVVVPKKKNLISKEKPKVKKKIVVQKEDELPLKDINQQSAIDPVLSRFIANELKERKKLLRDQYAKLIESIQNKILQFISIQIGDEFYAIDIDQVKEIVLLPNLSKTPNTPPHIKGIANVRGKNYTVFDLATRFKIEKEIAPKFLLLLNNQDIKASLTLPFLPSTFKVSGKNISSELNMIEDASLDVSYIKGIIQFGDKLIYYLDISEMLINDKAVVIPDSMITG